MKKVLFVILFSALLLFSACGKAPAPEREVISQPPELTVTVTEGSVTRHGAPYNWTFLDEKGQERQGAVTPGIPAEWIPHNPHLETAGQTATLAFALPPDEIGITCREAATGGSGSCKLDGNGALVLTDGSWVYEIMAQWTDESRPYHGWAKYTVCIEKK